MNLFFSLVVGAASITPSRLGRVGVKIMIYYLLTTVIAVIFGHIFGNLFRPGKGLNLATGKALAQPSVIDTLLDMGRTCLNVTGDLVGTAIVAKIEKELDLYKWGKT
jgi:Na+/H+-dicarboxylate symporter